MLPRMNWMNDGAYTHIHNGWGCLREHLVDVNGRAMAKEVVVEVQNDAVKNNARTES